MKMHKILYYSALLFGLLVSLFFTFFLIADGVTDLFEGKFKIIPLLIIMILSVGGYAWSVVKPSKGGIVMIAGGLVMALYLLVVGGIGEWQMALIFGMPFILPGLAFHITANKVPLIWFINPKAFR